MFGFGLRLRRKRSIINTVKNVMWKELCILIWDFMYARSVVCAAMICVIGYDKSTVMHKKRKCIHERYEYFQSKIVKFLCREPIKIPDSVIRSSEAELHNSDNILYNYSQVDSLTIPMLDQLLKKNKLMRHKRDIYNLYFTINKKAPPQLSIRECQKAEMYILNS